MSQRTATIQRKTAETEISLSLTLDGTGQVDVQTGVEIFTRSPKGLDFPDQPGAPLPTLL